jgi:hypothetical protein
MKRSPGRFVIIALSMFAVSLLAMPSGMLAQQRLATIAVRPTNITRPESVTLSVTSPNGLDLSHVSSNQVAIEPADGISLLQAIPQPGANELRVDFSIDGSAQLGPRTLIIFGDDHLVLASATFTVLADFPSNCPGGQECCEIDSTTGLCRQCRSSCPHPVLCPPGQHCCDNDSIRLSARSGRCAKCVPIQDHCM